MNVFILYIIIHIHDRQGFRIGFRTLSARNSTREPSWQRRQLHWSSCTALSQQDLHMSPTKTRGSASPSHSIAVVVETAKIGLSTQRTSWEFSRPCRIQGMQSFMESQAVLATRGSLGCLSQVSLRLLMNGFLKAGEWDVKQGSVQNRKGPWASKVEDIIHP